MKTIDVGTGSIWGTNVDDQIWFKSERTEPWQKVEGNLKQISVGHAGDVWGVTSGGQIYFREFDAWTDSGYVKAGSDDPLDVWDAGVEWKQKDGHLKQLSVGPNGELWGVSYNRQIWYSASKDSSWTSIDGGLSQIDIGANGLVIGVDNENIFIRTGTQDTTG